MKRRAVLLLLVGVAVIGLSLAAWPDTQVAAQTDTEITWSPPANLSHSGVATGPLMVIDTNGRFHLLWQDAFDGLVYTSGDGTVWMTPMLLESPFNTRRFFPDLRDEQPTPKFVPQLIAGPDGRIHAFWKDDWENNENVLYTSSVAADEFLEFDAWREPQKLSDSAPECDVSIGPDGRLHLIYLQASHTEPSPAGITYRQSADDGLTWSEPISLYESIYFRLLAPGDAHPVVAVGEDGRVHAAWDDPRLGKIFFAQSFNSGLTWREPQEIAAWDLADSQPTELEGEVESGYPGLVDLVSASAGTIHLVWQGQAGIGDTCALYHQSSADNGASWNEPQMLPAGQCGPARQVLQGEGGSLLVHTAGDEGDMMLAWDGEIWSEPFPLPTDFEDPESGRAVRLGRVQAALSDTGRLLVVGCDLAGGGDIWMQSQMPGASAEELFVTPTPVPTSVWGMPVTVPLLDSGEGPVNALDPAIAADANVQGRFHLVWSQPAGDEPEGPGRSLYYARWDALDPGRYPRPVTLFTSADEKAEQPALAADAAGRLHLVWSGNQVGEIMYSRAAADSAFNPSNWAEPQLLPMPQPAGSWPVIAIDWDGVIHVVFAVALNERRGVYHTCSADGGESWTEPSTIADGAKAGWAMVDHPALAIGGDGTIHVAWGALPLPGSLQPGAIYYARSGNCGESWSEPFEAADGPVDWPQLAAVGTLEVHLVWAETAGRAPRQHRWSADGGQTWSRANPIPGLERVAGPVGLILDGASRVHLAAVGAREEYPGSIEDRLPLHHRFWDGEHWIEVEGGPTTIESITPHSLALATSLGDRLGLALAGSRLEAGEDSEGDEEGKDMVVGLIALLSRSLELPAVLPTPRPTLTPTPTPLPQPTASPTLVPTPTPDLSGDTSAQVQVGPVTLPGDWAGLVVGAVPAAIVVLLASLIGVLVVRGRR